MRVLWPSSAQSDTILMVTDCEKAGGIPKLARILVIDDDIEIQKMLAYVLEREGHEPVEAISGEDALRILEDSAPDLVILDLMLPGISGYDVCERIRATLAVPVLMLTARASEADMVRGLDTGADDYLTKPFSPTELLARLRALLRRSSFPLAPPSTAFQVGRVEIDVGRGRLLVDGSEVAVTRSEIAIIACLAVHAGEPIPARVLLKRALNYDCAEAQARAILKVRVSRLRQKLGDDSMHPTILTSVRGVGYALAKGEPLPVV